ncbi:putative CoA-binding protein [Rhizobium sp. SG_E_25_P2]|uniref:CoA-binding protein n=1 Tax=Rhizobium sp. SG_E_25_P2 TaxID=2879942 RepID=UPI002475D203|nr:CoA-binding protein [Rhizobium sp. SG_E_25_P2]MDH6266674.1 putative CoA-binding protein [Rhizobium sp. SG_E_25_P2]
MNHDSYDPKTIRDVLGSVNTIAVVGASANPARPSFGVMSFLIEKGYRVIPVNPGHAGGEILGQPVYARLADIPEAIDMVDVFRAADQLAGVIDEALALDPRPKAIWGQLSVRDDMAAEKAESEGVTVIMDRCPAIEYPRLIG